MWKTHNQTNTQPHQPQHQRGIWGSIHKLCMRCSGRKDMARLAMRYAASSLVAHYFIVQTGSCRQENHGRKAMAIIWLDAISPVPWSSESVNLWDLMGPTGHDGIDVKSRFNRPGGEISKLSAFPHTVTLRIIRFTAGMMAKIGFFKICMAISPMLWFPCVWSQNTNWSWAANPSIWLTLVLLPQSFWGKLSRTKELLQGGA